MHPSMDKKMFINIYIRPRLYTHTHRVCLTITSIILVLVSVNIILYHNIMYSIDADLGAFEKILGKNQSRSKRLQFEKEDRVEGADDGEESSDSWYMIEIGPGTLTNVLNELGR